MKQIKLTQGKFALVDDDDFEYLNQWKWHRTTSKYTTYASTRINGVKKLMHRIILNVPNGMETDHRDRNGLNNQRNNIRICNSSQNKANRRTVSKSGYLGVWYRTKNNIVYIKAQIRSNKIQYDLGTFNTEIEAAIAYDKAAKKYHGEFANLNFK